MKKQSSKLGTFLAMTLAMGGGLPNIKLPESNTEMTGLPKGFKKWCFNRDTGELITENILPLEKIRIFKIVSRSEGNARNQFANFIKTKGLRPRNTH